MNAEKLIELYDRVADAPDVIPKLRRFVLDLAVRGKLVEQDASEEPASFALQRHVAARLSTSLTPNVRAGNGDSAGEPSGQARLPAGWVWSTLGEVGEWGSGSTPSRAQADYYGGGYAWLKSGELGDSTALSGSEETITEKALRECTFRRNQRGDVLIAMYGATIGKLAILSEPAVTNQAVCGCTPLPFLLNRFLFLFLLSNRARFQALSEGGAQPNISKIKITNTAIPLPPLAEQHRIVARVDELMALLDRLEAARGAREATRDRFTTASLTRLTAPDPDTRAADTQSTLDALPVLTTRTDQIKQLRQVIFNLAVRGALVEQESGDVSATLLLELIAAEHGSASSHAQPSELPFAVPSGWVWCRLGALVRASDAGWSPRTESHPRQGDSWGVLKVSAVSWDHFDASANKQLLPGAVPPPNALIRRGDFLMSRANTAELVGRAVIVDIDPKNLIMSDKIVRLSLSANCDHRFVWLVNNYADHARAHYSAHATGVSPSMKNISRGVILSLPIPLPPLAEQHRIVAKVDELMALCDRLEAALTTADTTRARLLEALLHEALSPGQMRAGA